MSNIIRFVNNGLRITLLILDNGSVCQLRKGDETFRHTPPAWDSLSEWAGGDLVTLKNVYRQILSVSDDEILNLIALLKKNKMELNLYGNNTKAKVDYLFVKNTDGELVPLYVSYKGLVSYKGVVGASFKSVGLTNPDFWINDSSGTRINISQNSASNLNTVIEEEPLVWEQDSHGVMRWCHPIFRWFTENDGDVLPDWLKKLVEAHPKFRGWTIVPPTTASPYVDTTACCTTVGINLCDISCNIIQSNASVESTIAQSGIVPVVSSNVVTDCSSNVVHVTSNVVTDCSSNVVHVTSNVVTDCSSNVVPVSSNVVTDCSSNVVPICSNVVPDISSNVVPISSSVVTDCSSNVVPVCSNVVPISSNAVPVVSSNVVSMSCSPSDSEGLLTRVEKLEKQLAQQNAVLKGLTANSCCNIY